MEQEQVDDRVVEEATILVDVVVVVEEKVRLELGGATRRLRLLVLLHFRQLSQLAAAALFALMWGQLTTDDLGLLTRG